MKRVVYLAPLLLVMVVLVVFSSIAIAQSAQQGVVAVPVRDATAVPAQSMVRVSIRDNFFNPADALVAPGTTVVWVNEGGHRHSVNADDGQFSSGLLSPGDSFMVTFYGSGTLTYHCSASMPGSVTVT
jgi:plastocyanin